MMNEAEKPVINPEYSAEKFDDEILLYSKATTQAVYLNDAAHAVWLLCQEGMTIGQMIGYLEQLYPDQKSQIRRDVLSALKMLQENDVVRLEDD